MSLGQEIEEGTKWQRDSTAYDSLAAELLQRSTSPVYGHTAKKLIRGKTVLVTGAGGSIGSEIVRQLKRIDPTGKVHFIDNNEYALYTLQMSLNVPTSSDRARIHSC